MKSVFATLTTALFVLALLVPTTQAADTLRSVEDAAITALVKSKLVAARTANLTSVNVDTEQGVVHLKGTVPTDSDRQQAEELARGTNGVRQVMNEIAVQGQAATPGTATTSPSASPGSETFRGRHTVTGQVTQIDTNSGRVELSTPQGALSVVFPPDALQGIGTGDTLTVELAMKPGA